MGWKGRTHNPQDQQQSAMDHQSGSDCAAESGPAQPPWRQTESALWQGLTDDARELILEQTLNMVLNHMDAKSFRNVRLINKAFATTLLPRMGLFHPRLATDFVPIFVKHAMMFAAECARGIRYWGTHNAVTMYNQVYMTCFRTEPTEALYGALIPTLDALMIDGTLRALNEAQRETFAHYMGCIFGYLERFYIPRCRLTSVKQHLLLGIASHRSEA